MEIKIIEEKKGKIMFEIDKSHTFCNALKAELWNDSHVKSAGYSVKHPLISKPVIILETDGADTKKTLIAAAQRLKKTCEKFEEGFNKEVK